VAEWDGTTDWFDSQDGQYCWTDFLQLCGRFYRFGQLYPTTLYTLHVRNTADDPMRRCAKRKMRLFWELLYPFGRGLGNVTLDSDSDSESDSDSVPRLTAGATQDLASSSNEEGPDQETPRALTLARQVRARPTIHSSEEETEEETPRSLTLARRVRACPSTRSSVGGQVNSRATSPPTDGDGADGEYPGSSPAADGEDLISSPEPAPKRKRRRSAIEPATAPFGTGNGRRSLNDEPSPTKRLRQGREDRGVFHGSSSESNEGTSRKHWPQPMTDASSPFVSGASSPITSSLTQRPVTVSVAPSIHTSALAQLARLSIRGQARRSPSPTAASTPTSPASSPSRRGSTAHDVFGPTLPAAVSPTGNVVGAVLPATGPSTLGRPSARTTFAPSGSAPISPTHSAPAAQSYQPASWSMADDMSSMDVDDDWGAGPDMIPPAADRPQAHAPARPRADRIDRAPVRAEASDIEMLASGQALRDMRNVAIPPSRPWARAPSRLPTHWESEPRPTAPPDTVTPHPGHERLIPGPDGGPPSIRFDRQILMTADLWSPASATAATAAKTARRAAIAAGLTRQGVPVGMPSTSRLYGPSAPHGQGGRGRGEPFAEVTQRSTRR
jgi:hypothetical protein